MGNISDFRELMTGVDASVDFYKLKGFPWEDTAVFRGVDRVRRLECDFYIDHGPKVGFFVTVFLEEPKDFYGCGIYGDICFDFPLEEIEGAVVILERVVKNGLAGLLSIPTKLWDRSLVDRHHFPKVADVGSIPTGPTKS